MLASAVPLVLIADTFLLLVPALDSTSDSGGIERHSRVELASADRMEKYRLAGRLVSRLYGGSAAFYSS